MRTKLTTSRTGTRLVVSGAIAQSDIVRLKGRLIEAISGADDTWTLDVTKVESSSIQLLQLLVSAVATTRAAGRRVTVAAHPGCPVFELAQATGLLAALALGDAAIQAEAGR